MTTYFECHVTCTGDPVVIKGMVKGFGWSYSSIDNEVNLGEGVKQYATRQFNSKIGLSAAIAEVTEMAQVLRDKGITIHREKVEEVLYDTRSSKVQCTDCAACQESR